MRTNRIISVVVLTAASVLALRGAQAQQAGTKRTDLQRHDLSAPGREVVQVRVDFDPGYVASRHTHPGEEIIYVIEGSLEYEIDGKLAKVKAGDVLPKTSAAATGPNSRPISSKKGSRSSRWSSERTDVASSRPRGNSGANTWVSTQRRQYASCNSRKGVDDGGGGSQAGGRFPDRPAGDSSARGRTGAHQGAGLWCLPQ
jgi:Cupin domain